MRAFPSRGARGRQPTRAATGCCQREIGIAPTRSLGSVHCSSARAIAAVATGPAASCVRSDELGDAFDAAALSDAPDRDVGRVHEGAGQGELARDRSSRRELGESRVRRRVRVNLDQERVRSEREVVPRRLGQAIEETLCREPFHGRGRDQPGGEGDRPESGVRGQLRGCVCSIGQRRGRQLRPRFGSHAREELEPFVGLGECRVRLICRSVRQFAHCSVRHRRRGGVLGYGRARVRDGVSVTHRGPARLDAGSWVPDSADFATSFIDFVTPAVAVLEVRRISHAWRDTSGRRPPRAVCRAPCSR